MNMSRVIQVWMFGIKARWFQFKYMMMLNTDRIKTTVLTPLNAKLNPICHLLPLLWAHPILHISRIRVKQQNTNDKVVVNKQRNVSVQTTNK